VKACFVLCEGGANQLPNFEEKQKVVDNIKEKFQGASGVVLAD
jgi:ribosomal protein L10